MSEIRIAIIDDDPFVIAHLKQAILHRLPDAAIVGVADPVAPAGFDVYVVDREFDGDTRGREVVQRIRAVAPQSLVLAYSAHLDREFLRALLREDCDGAFDKGSLVELEAMIEVIEAHLDAGVRGSSRRGLGATVQAISGLVREWNLRLAASGRAEPRIFRDA